MKRTNIGSELVSALCDYLALKGYFFWRSNNVPVFDRGSGGFRKLPKYSRKGLPDILVLHRGKFIGIEAKAGSGRLSPDQADFGRMIVTNGGDFILARSIDDVQRAGL